MHISTYVPSSSSSKIPNPRGIPNSALCIIIDKLRSDMTANAGVAVLTAYCLGNRLVTSVRTLLLCEHRLIILWELDDRSVLDIILAYAFI